MNHAELAAQIAGTHGLSQKQAKWLITKIFNTITAAATKGEEVALPGFGRFKVQDRPARVGKNPATGESIDIPASKKLAFMPGKKVKEALNPAP